MIRNPSEFEVNSGPLNIELTGVQVTNYGEGGMSSFTPTKKGVGRKSFSHAEGVGDTTSFEIVCMR